MYDSQSYLIRSYYLISDVKVDMQIKEVTPTNNKGATVS